ncbi:MAG TPA: pyruvate dehydrogenase complex dihydrolipoamide acetyltransferase, partial [Alphaproteobacteria bacterium]|nr:pyruvate dehydrogenase complex dihydrolipoamide acetyltransferase [Alphaproteobacteria bacterium]
TDKATMELEAVDEGVLGRILVPAGTQGVKVQRPIALLLAPGEDESALDDAKTEPAPAPAPESEPAPAAKPAEA